MYEKYKREMAYVKEKKKDLRTGTDQDRKKDYTFHAIKMVHRNLSEKGIDILGTEFKGMTWDGRN